MKITKFQQSGFIIETSSGFKLAIDIGNKTTVEELENLTADAFIVSHVHGDHFSLPQIKALSPRKVYLNHECYTLIENESLQVEIIKSDDSLKITDNLKVEVFTVDHGPNISAPLAENFGFLIEADSQKIYFAGDIFYESGMDVSKLTVDYALIPVGGFYTFGPKEALEFVRKFQSIGKVTPMHYDKSPETKDEFVALASNLFAIE